MVLFLKTVEVEMFEWYGINNENTCALSISNYRSNRNWGFIFLPITLWRTFYFHNDWLGYQNKRFSMGLGLFSFYFDYYSYET